MLIIKFHFKDKSDVLPDSGFFGIDEYGRILIAPVSIRGQAELSGFEGSIDTLVGICTLNKSGGNQQVYTFADITPELLSSGIFGLGPVTCTTPQFSIITKSLGETICWSRGIEKIFYIE